MARGKKKINEDKRTKTDAAELAEMINIQLNRRGDFDCPHGRASASRCNVCRGRVLRHPNVKRQARVVKNKRVQRDRRRDDLRSEC